MIRFFLAIFFLITISSAVAEYRVYQYMIRNTKEQTSSVVESTLSPNSFAAYHGGSLATKVDLIKTWRCMGNTSGHMPLCLPPEKKMVVVP